MSVLLKIHVGPDLFVRYNFIFKKIMLETKTSTFVSLIFPEYHSIYPGRVSNNT